MDFSKAQREAIYQVIRARRDIRHFTSRPIPEDALERILEAAHHAPSVGFKQPWNFILITSKEIRQRVKEGFEKVNAKELERLEEGRKKELYSRLKLEGILESPLNIAVTCDRKRDAPFVLGQRPMPDTDIYSTCLAVQNMWLAARAEGIGLGWVSILDTSETEKILGLPDHVQLIAYLCIGYPIQFEPEPMLQQVGWKSRMKLDKLVYRDTWGKRYRFGVCGGSGE